MKKPNLPAAPSSIQKGVPLKEVLGYEAIDHLGANLKWAYLEFDSKSFRRDALGGIEERTLKERASFLAVIMKQYLPGIYSNAIEVILNSLTPPVKETSGLGLSGMFYMPHVSFIEQFGLDRAYNSGIDPFDISMKAQFELTRRFTSEFSIRAYVIDQPERTFSYLYQWMDHPDPHVRRLCSEGTRPRLPWAQKIALLVKDPGASIPILEKLKNDPDLYVRRSVANHVGDIAKDNLDLALDLCRSWVPGASKELKWVIRHALRHPAKKQNAEALEIRSLASPR